MNLTVLRKMKQKGEKITCLTAYDAGFAKLFELAGIDMLMVGDSLGMVIQGQSSTLSVTLENIIYHTQNVRRGSSNDMFIIADMPFMTYANPQQGLDNAARLLQEGQANMIKLEGGSTRHSEIVALISQNGIPICAHLGLLPQSVNKLGGYRVQGRTDQAAQTIFDDALSLQASGADMLVLECVPLNLAKKISQKLTIPVIGIGAGPHCDGQVLVSYDMLGISQMDLPRFVKDFTQESGKIESAVKQFVEEVKSGRFPAPEHCYE